MSIRAATGSGLGRTGGNGIPTPNYFAIYREARARPAHPGNVGLASANPLRSAMSHPAPVSAGPSSASSGSGHLSTVPKRGALARNPSVRTASIPAFTSALNSSLRRTKSYHSHRQTAAFTPELINFRRPSPPLTICRRGLIKDASDKDLDIKIPKDRSAQMEMAKFIFEFLESQGCQSKPVQFQALVAPPSISVSQFMSIVKFVASRLMKESFFETGEVLDKIMEASKILKYPGSPITRSHMRTATAPHAWPTSLTFLHWLCRKTNGLLNPPREQAQNMERAKPNEEMAKDRDEIGSESKESKTAVHPPKMEIPETEMKFKNSPNINNLILQLKEHELGIDARRAEISKIKAKFESQSSTKEPANQVGKGADHKSREMEISKGYLEQLDDLLKQVEELQSKLDLLISTTK